MRAALALLLAAGLAAPARAQDRSPAQRQTLLELASVLGEAHALRTLCEGKGDQSWRNRMARVTELEQPDEAFRARLVERFNTGFVGAGAAHTTCDARAKADIRAVASRGRDLASGLSGARMETAAAR